MASSAMSARRSISRDSISKLREAIAVSDVVGRYVELSEPRGGNRKGLCPFHSEVTPSFTTNDVKELYYCFGCGEHGDSIDFYRKLEGSTFTEAVEAIADMANFELEYLDSSSSDQEEYSLRQRLIKANEAAQEYFVNKFMDPDAEPARAMILERGFDIQSSVITFQVGYAPRSWSDLSNHLMSKGFTAEEIIQAGLAVEGDKGPRDRFSGRLMWPIRNPQGKTVGFGGRKLFEEDNGGKYINTTETPIYNKSTTLYGMDLARKHINQEGNVYVVEGYTDVMAMHAAGIHNVVASSGTAFGPKHLGALRTVMAPQGKWRGRVVFSFDGDSAGIAAGRKAFERLAGELSGHMFVAKAPDGMDPCDLRLTRGDEALREAMDAQEPMGDFLIRSTASEFDLSTPQGKYDASQEVIEIINHVDEPVLRESYADLASKVIGVDSSSISSGLKETRGNNHSPTATAPLAAMGDEALEWESLRALLQHPEASNWTIFFTSSDFSTPMTRAAAGVVVGHEDLSIDGVLSRCKTDAGKAKVHELVATPLVISESTDSAKYANNVLGRLSMRVLDKKIHTLKSELEHSDSEDINRRLFELTKERKDLKSLWQELSS